MTMKTMLDSGAYSAWTKGTEINFDEYIAFIKRFGHFFDVVVNLDVIPGFGGQREHCPEAIEHAAARSYENLQRMRDAGINAIPVYHQDDGAHWLERLLDDGERFIGLSAWKRQHQGDIIAFLDACFDVITKADRPLIKTHGFGATAPVICHRYPWWSVGIRSGAVAGIQQRRARLHRPTHDRFADRALASRQPALRRAR
jgi:hypothetical protein